MDNTTIFLDSNTSVNHTSSSFYIWGYQTYFKDSRISQWFCFWIAGVLLTCVSIFGIIGNALSALQLRRLIVDEKTPRHLLLLALSYCDFVVCLYALAFFGLSVVSSQFWELDWYVKWICSWNVYSFPFLITAYYGSTLFTQAITVERLVVIFKPLQAPSLLTFGRTKYIVGSLFAFAIVASSPTFVYYFFADHKTPYDPISNTCEYGKYGNGHRNLSVSNNRTSRSFSQLTDTLIEKYDIFYGALTRYIPLPMITVANIVMIIKVMRTHRIRKTLTASQIKTLKTTKMLLTLMLVYTVCNITQFFTGILAIVLGEQALVLELHFIPDFTIILNCSVNYVIYCAFGNGFKDSFRNILRRSYRSKARTSGIITHNFRPSSNTAISSSKFKK